jgi:ABC-2 type transport system ATP-binding protein
MNAIETHQLTRAFGERLAVDQLTLSIPVGTVFGFLGPNGAGKTTTVRMLTALIGPSGGSALVNRQPLGAGNEAIRRSVGILTETPGLYERLTADQNLLFFGRLYGLDLARAKAQTERYLRMLGLWERRDDKVGGFSKGMRQKIAIARALLHEPTIVFLDEPTVALPFVRAVAANESELAITLDDPDAQNPVLIQALVAAGALIRYVEPIEHSLEDVYLELVQDTL